MSDKQYDGMLLDMIDDYDYLLMVAEDLPEGHAKERMIEAIAGKKRKVERKLESPATN